ncbi:hypothetical protein HNR04_001386 [Corynebacterium durum]|nr:hypothetical protein [Corynebacterium durum]
MHGCCGCCGWPVPKVRWIRSPILSSSADISKTLHPMRPSKSASAGPCWFVAKIGLLNYSWNLLVGKYLTDVNSCDIEALCQQHCGHVSACFENQQFSYQWRYGG